MWLQNEKKVHVRGKRIKKVITPKKIVFNIYYGLHKRSAKLNTTEARNQPSY